MEFSKKYPLLATWAECEGRIEIGPDHYGDGMLRVIDENGIVWEDETSETVDEALERAEQYLQNDFEDEFGYKVGE